LYNDPWAEFHYAVVYALGEYSEPLLCRLEDGVVYNNGLRIVMLNGDPLLRRVTEIIDLVVEAELYNFWISLDQHLDKVVFQIIYIVNPLDEYYKLQTVTHATCLLSPFNCLNALCFIFDLFYNRLVNISY